MADTNKRSDDLGADDQRVFELLADARAQYEEYLKTQDFLGQNGFQMPTSDDYSWEKPLTVVLCR